LRFRTLADFSWIDEVKLWTLPLLVACLVGLASSAYLALRQPAPMDPIQQAFEYSRRHPGEVYLPQFPLVHLMSEDKLYHFSWGLTDRRNAGRPIREAHFQAHIPAEAQFVAITNFVPHYETDMSQRIGSRIPFDDHRELPGFAFYQLRR
jgi:hypothetical protein